MPTEQSAASLLAQAQAESEANYDRTVREDIAKFRAVAGKFAAGEMTADEFRPHRFMAQPRGVAGREATAQGPWALRREIRMSEFDTKERRFKPQPGSVSPP